MNSGASVRSWLPQMWEEAARWHLAEFAGGRHHDLGALLPGALVGHVIQTRLPSHREASSRLLDLCLSAVATASDDILFQCNPAHLTMTLALSCSTNRNLSSNAVDYLTTIRSVFSDSAAARRQALRHVFSQENPDPGREDEADEIKLADFVSDFGGVLSEIENRTAYGTKTAAFAASDRLLLYAGAARAISLDSLSDAARALRCLHYVSSDAADHTRAMALIDAIGARQEPEGHFGDSGADHERIARCYNALWAILEVTSDYRLLLTLAPLAECEELALKQVIADQIKTAMSAEGLSKTAIAERMRTSRR